MLKVFVPKERQPGEARVAATPETIKRLIKEGFQVSVEAGAGEKSFLSDEAYAEAGATLVTKLTEAWSGADLILKVTGPAANPELGKHEAEAMKEGAVFVGFIAPHKHLDAVKMLAANKVETLAMELVPRISRAQSMDALSSQANIAGYKAVLLAATNLAKYCPLLMTAAGTVKPAHFVIMGAGVAGLQAIATARRLGAVVEVSDIRPAVKEQVESLGGKFIDLPEMDGEGEGGYAKEVTPEFLAKQQEIVAKRVMAADAVITTALVPGRPAPKLVTAAMVEGMRPGSVIVDLAVEAGGNCELSEQGSTVVRHGVTIIGEPNLPATMPTDASMLYARNVQTLILNFAKGAELNLDLEDEVTNGTLLTHAGQVHHAPTRKLLEGGAA